MKKLLSVILLICLFITLSACDADTHDLKNQIDELKSTVSEQAGKIAGLEEDNESLKNKVKELEEDLQNKNEEHNDEYYLVDRDGNDSYSSTELMDCYIAWPVITEHIYKLDESFIICFKKYDFRMHSDQGTEPEFSYESTGFEVISFEEKEEYFKVRLKAVKRAEWLDFAICYDFYETIRCAGSIAGYVNEYGMFLVDGKSFPDEARDYSFYYEYQCGLMTRSELSMTCNENLFERLGHSYKVTYSSHKMRTVVNGLLTYNNEEAYSIEYFKLVLFQVVEGKPVAICEISPNEDGSYVFEISGKLENIYVRLKHR